MPLTYVNPAPRRRTKNMPAGLRAYWSQRNARKKVTRKARRNGSGRSMLTGPGWGTASSKLKSAAAMAGKRKNPRRKRRQPAALRAYWAKKRAKANPVRKRRTLRRRNVSGATSASNPGKKRKSMKRRKLYGAAARAHARKKSRRKARHGHSRKKRKGSSRSRKRSLAAKKAARTRAAKKARRSAAGRKAARSRRRRGRKGTHRTTRRRRRRNPATVAAAPTSNPRRRRRRKHRSNPTRRRRYRRARRNPRPTTARSMFRARRSIRNRYKTSLAKAVKRRFRMRSNPTSIKGTIGGFVAVLKQAAPIALSLYGSRMVSSKLLAKSLPGINRLPAAAQAPVMAAIVAWAGNQIAKRVKPLQKYRGAINMGTGLNLFDAVFAAIAPASVKGFFGLSDVYQDMGDYLTVGDYMTVGSPIDDDITLSGLSDYVEVGVEEELGLDEELGLQEELGASGLNRAYLGGVSQGSLLKQVPEQSMLQKIPDRSFTKEIPAAGSGYDNSNILYGGVFAGGF